MNAKSLSLILLLVIAPVFAGAADLDADKATHKETAVLDIEFGTLTAICMSPDGELLASDAESKVIKVISSDHKVEKEFKLSFGPEAIDVGADGLIYCGGQGELAVLDRKGKVLRSANIPKDAASETSRKGGRRSASRGIRVSGIAVSDKDVFVTFGSGWSLRSKAKLYRFDKDLKNPVMLAEGLRGCCQRCDISVRNGYLYVAENAAHRVVKYDRDGGVVGKWGTKSRDDIKGFGSCCNPMNICFAGKNGVIYTSESGMARVKKHSLDGKFIELVGYVGTKRFERASHQAASCSNIAIAASQDGKSVYVMDYTANRIRLLEKQ